MSYTEFLEIFQKLENYFNKHDDDIRMFYYKSFCNLKKNVFNQIVTTAIEQCEFFPKIVKLKEFKEQIKGEEYKPVQCEKCNGTGMLLYTKEVEGYKYEYAMKCSCINAQRLSKNIPTASEVGIGEMYGNN